MARAMGVENAARPEDFIGALVQLQKDCGVDGLKMSDYGIQPDECMTLAKGARSMQGGLYAGMWADYQHSAQWKVGKEEAV